MAKQPSITDQARAQAQRLRTLEQLVAEKRAAARAAQEEITKVDARLVELGLKPATAVRDVEKLRALVEEQLSELEGGL